MGAVICCMSEQSEKKSLEKKLEKKIAEIRRNKFGQTKLKSVDSIIMLFPMFKERLKTLRAMFEEYGKLQNNPNILF
jgi:calcium-binding protein CML